MYIGPSYKDLNTLLTVGQSVTMTLLTTNGSTAYYCTSVTVDAWLAGTTTTVKWQGGAPTSGNANSIDAYVFNVIKTADKTFTVLASQTKFA
jgi:hypothetical protein